MVSNPLAFLNKGIRSLQIALDLHMAAWILNQQHRLWSSASTLTAFAKNSHPERLACTVSPDFEAGSFNVVLEFTNGDQWVARVPCMPWSPMLERRMRSDMLGYELIARRILS